MSMTLSRIKNAARMLKTEGPGYTFRQAGKRLLLYARARLSERLYERRFGIRTRGRISLESLGIDDPDAVWYSPTSYAAFFSAMKHVPISGAFVDYGSGLGRTVIAAGTLPFNRIMGIELSQSLAGRSLENVAKARGMICKNIELICANAADWHVTSDVTVFHFYNPFLKQTLRTVIENIAQSLREAPRQAWIVFANPWGMGPIMRSGEVIPHEWQKHTIDEIWPWHPLPKDDPDGARYRIYALDSRRTSVVPH
jgi:hypothetical protein